MSETSSQSTEEVDAQPEAFEYAPDGAFRWPAPDRDSPQLGTFNGRFDPDPRLGALLLMDGRDGRSEEDVLEATGQDIQRPRRWHKIFERMGILYPGGKGTRLGRLGRLLRDVSNPDGLRRLLAREALEVLKRYQFNNPIEKSLPEDCDVHPYYAVLRAAACLDWRIHWDEVNREIMRVTRDDQLDDAIRRIKNGRSDPAYADFIGGASNGPGPLQSRTHPAEPSAPKGKTPEGQLRDQRMTPFLKRVGFSELLLSSPGLGGHGYWTVPEPLRDVVQAGVEHPPASKSFATEQEWIEWFCEGTLGGTISPSPPLKVATPVNSLTVSALKAALSQFEADLVFSDTLLASVVAALRAGDGRNFIILRGISGTGKSRLVSAIAKAVYGVSVVEAPNLTLTEVRPDWTDGSYLLGHFDPIAGKYVRERFLEALLAAETSWKGAPQDCAPFFICLDEMNLARVEYYLADCLSAMESGNSIRLDTRDDYTTPHSVCWPPNFYLFATVNIDETTHRISDKVLDRAQVIDTSDVDLLPQMDKWLASQGHLEDLERERITEIVGEVWRALQPVGAQFGFRTAKAIIRFIAEAKASSEGTLTLDQSIDVQLVQKVLVKLRGEGDRWAVVLSKIETVLSKLGDTSRALSTIRRMRTDLERFGSFQFWN